MKEQGICQICSTPVRIVAHGDLMLASGHLKRSGPPLRIVIGEQEFSIPQEGKMCRGSMKPIQESVPK